MAHCGNFSSTSVRKCLRTLGSAIVRKLVGHPENKCGEKGYGENGSKSICRYCGRVPRWLPNQNERGSSRHNCQHKTNNCNCSESKDYILAKFKFGRHGLNHSGPLASYFGNAASTCNFITRAITASKDFSARQHLAADRKCPLDVRCGS